MDQMIDIVKDFNNYILQLNNNEKLTKIKFSRESMIEFFSMRQSFSFLTRFENEADFRKYVNISDIFKKSMFYLKSYHEDTNEYNEYNALIQKHRSNHQRFDFEKR